MTEGAGTSSGTGAWREFRRTPSRLQAYVGVALVAAVRAAVRRPPAARARNAPTWLTVAVLVGISVLNVEIGRRLFGGLSHTQQPHKALSAWAFSCARAAAAALAAGGRPVHVRPRALARAAGPAVEVGRLGGVPGARRTGRRHRRRPGGRRPDQLDVGHRRARPARAGARRADVRGRRERAVRRQRRCSTHAEDEEWLRRTLRDPSFYLTELGVLFVACLLVAVWTGGPWFVLLLLPLYALAQRAALHEPMRERAEAAAAARREERAARGGQPVQDRPGGHARPRGRQPADLDRGLRPGRARGDRGRRRRAGAALLRGGRAQRRPDRAGVRRHPRAGQERARRPVRPSRSPATCGRSSRPRPPGSRPAGSPSSSAPTTCGAQVQPDHLDQVVANLLSNADKYGGGATRIVAVADGQRPGRGVGRRRRAPGSRRSSRAGSSSGSAATSRRRGRRRAPAWGCSSPGSWPAPTVATSATATGRPSGSVFTLTLPRGTARRPCLRVAEPLSRRPAPRRRPTTSSRARRTRRSRAGCRESTTSWRAPGTAT